jgi:hypothetical protein
MRSGVGAGFNAHARRSSFVARRFDHDRKPLPPHTLPTYPMESPVSAYSARELFARGHVTV